MRIKQGGFALTALTALALSAPAVASATDRFVDAETGADAGTCDSSAAPCDTIAFAIANSAAGDEIFIDNGSYPESVTVGDGKSLTQSDFVAADGDGPAVVDGGASTAITVAASGAGHIRGLTVRSDASAQVTLNGVADVDSNGFDDADAGGFVVGVMVNAPGSTVHDNTFVDPAPSATHGRIGVVSFSSAVTISDNTFTGLMLAAQAGGPGAGQTTLIEDNTITGTHQLPVAGRAILAGGSPGSIIVRENTISDPNVSIGTGSVDGIHPQGPVSLVRNEITGHNNGVFVGSDTTGVTLEGDRIWGNSADGLSLFDNNGPTGGQTSASATNVTMVGNGGADFRSDSSTLTLDSSIVEDWSSSGTGTCNITFSRGDSTGDPSTCDDFQTTADPMFVNAAAGDFHLQPGSPMIDMGNPSDPEMGAVDFEGDPRATIGTQACVARRDIGADEFVPAPAIDCDPPETTIDTGPADGSVTNDSTPTFTFSADETSTFECSVDGAGFGACSGPGAAHTTSELDDGVRTFAVRATDTAGNPDPNPPEVEFTVDTVAPDTTIDSGPNGVSTNDDTPTFTFSADEPSTFECAVDGPPFGACSGVGEHTTAPLDDGDHTFTVRATDTAGNPSPDPATFAFTVDTIAPNTTFTRKPPKRTRRKRARFAFTANDQATFRCKLDSRPAFTCTSPVRLRVRAGRHRFRVTATDEAGNAEGAPAVHRFRRLPRRR